MQTRWLALIAVGYALIASPPGLSSQATDTLDVGSVLIGLRRTGSGSDAAAFLSQHRRARSPTELRELADSLVAIANAYRVGQAQGAQRTARAAIRALASSVKPASVAARTERFSRQGQARTPVPYDGAFDALVRIYHGSPDMRGATLSAITDHPDTVRVVRLLADLASSRDLAASTAIHLLATRMGPAGLAALQRLFESDSVILPHARQALEALASRYGWR